MTALSAAFEARYVAQSEAQAAKQGPIEAEIIPETEPLWHLLKTWPNHESIAAGHLIARKYGIYLPFIRSRAKDQRGHEQIRARKMFPGYLLLWCWDVLHHKRRIESVPGISGIIHFAGNPVVVPDQLIDQMQVYEVMQEHLLAKPKRKRNRIDIDGQKIKIWTKGLDKLDDEARNLVLNKALGLA